MNQRRQGTVSLIALLCVLLTACDGSQGSYSFAGRSSSGDLEQGNPRAQATTKLDDARELASPERERQQLQAASQLVRLDTWSFPAQWLHEAPLLPETAAWQQTVQAQLSLLHGQPGQAQNILQHLSDDAQDPLLALKRHVTLAEAHLAKHQLQAAMDQYAWLNQHAATEHDQQRLWQAVWYRLLQQPSYRISHALKHTASPWVAGWLGLAQLAMHPWPTAAERRQAISDWQQQYPEHPGIHVLRIHDQDIVPQHLDHIALLLPLHGVLASAGQAVRDGLMSAYFDHTPAPQKRRIFVYDTSTLSLHDIQAQLKRDDIDFVIGPLAKPTVEQWVQQDVQQPTLLLNGLDHERPLHTYQLTLSPVESITQVVQRAQKDGHYRAWLITDQSYWGQHLAQAFKASWENHGGMIAEETIIDPATLSKDIARSLGVSESRHRIRAWRGLLGHKLRALPHRYHDRDMVFLATDVKQARAVRPLLQYHFAGQLPVYATPSVYMSQASGHRDHDLDGVRFCDAPWVIHTLSGRPNTQNPSLKRLQQALKKLWPKAFNHQTRFFALGIDAYQLLDALPHMHTFQISHQGATGKLHLDDQGRIQRGLQWMVFRRGYPAPMPHLWHSDDWGLQVHLDEEPSEPHQGSDESAT